MVWGGPQSLSFKWKSQLFSNTKGTLLQCQTSRKLYFVFEVELISIHLYNPFQKLESHERLYFIIGNSIWFDRLIQSIFLDYNCQDALEQYHDKWKINHTSFNLSFQKQEGMKVLKNNKWWSTICKKKFRTQIALLYIYDNRTYFLIILQYFFFQRSISSQHKSYFRQLWKF